MSVYLHLTISLSIFIYPNLSIYLNPSTDYLQCESNKNVGFTAPVQKYNFFCATLLYGVFFNIFWKFLIYLVLLWSKKKIRTLFSLKRKSLEKQNVYINYFYQNLKFYKDWITEPQKIGKIVTKKTRNFQFWSNF